MKSSIVFMVIALALGAIFVSSSNHQMAAPDDRVIPEVIVLAEKAVLGKVTFNHGDHIAKKRNTDGTANLNCVDCHHAEQTPVAGKTVYPADRKVTLTADTYKDGTAPAVTACGVCHLAKDGKPTILTEVPKVGTTVLSNQNALHRACATCHDGAVKARPNLVAPTAMKCMGCHKKA